MHLRRDDYRLRLTDHSGAILVLGGFFTLVGSVFVYGGLGGASNVDQLSAGERFLVIAMGCAGVAAGLFVALGHRAVHVELDRASRTLRLTTRQWGRRVVETFPPGAVAAVVVRAQRDSDGDLLHGLELLLRDGRTVPLAMADATPRATAEEVAGVLQREAGVKELRVIDAPLRTPAR